MEVGALPLVGQGKMETYSDVDFVCATHTGDGLWRFDLTVSHDDARWDNCADCWQVVDQARRHIARRARAATLACQRAALYL